MKGRNRILFIMAVFILSATEIFCQDRTISNDFITSGFSDYVKAIPFEDMYVHTEGHLYGRRRGVAQSLAV